jgi:hypothetical protein
MSGRWWLESLKILLSIALAGLILFFVFKKVDWDAFIAKAETVNFFWVILAMALSVPGYILRAYRWKLQIEPLGYHPTTFRVFLAVMSGYLANLLIPRLGEITRCGVLFKSDRVPVSSSFGTVITERIVDVFCLALIILFTLLVETDQLLAFLDRTVDKDIPWKRIFIIGSAVLLIGAFVFFKWIYPSQTRLGSFSRNLFHGLLSLRRVPVIRYSLVTIAIWVIYFYVSYIVVFSMPETEHLSWQAGLAILSAGVIAFVLPVQSGFGTFHALVSAMLSLYAIDDTTGVFFASLLHTSQLLAVILLGLFASLISIFIRRHDIKRENKG